MEISRHWRLRHERYNLSGTACPHCGRLYATGRMICVDCHTSAAASAYHFDADDAAGLDQQRKAA